MSVVTFHFLKFYSVFPVHSHWECVERILPALKEISWNYCNQNGATRYQNNENQNTKISTESNLERVNNTCGHCLSCPLCCSYLNIKRSTISRYTTIPSGMIPDSLV